MPQVSDIILWVRRIVKLPNDEDMTDSDILSYLNRFYMYDMPLEIQLFDLRTTYEFLTQANVDRYNVPIDTYNSILSPATIDSVPVIMQQSTAAVQNGYPYQFQNLNLLTGNGTAGPYTYTLPSTSQPIIRGHLDVYGKLSSSVYLWAQDTETKASVLDGSGNPVTAQDNGIVNNFNQGGFIDQNGDLLLGSVDYLDGNITVTFNTVIPTTASIWTKVIPFTAGKPTSVLFYNNTLTFRSVPDKDYLVSFNAYLTPSAFLNTEESVTWSWMTEYFARGTARKILLDLGDMEQVQFYEAAFLEQRRNVLRRTGRQNSNVRTGSIYQGQTAQNLGYRIF